MSYINDKKAEVRKKYHELWDAGEFDWNHQEGETVGTKPISPERIFNVFVEPLINSIVSEVEEIGTREILKSRTVEEVGYGLGGRETTARAQAAVDFKLAFKHLREETT